MSAGIFYLQNASAGYNPSVKGSWDASGSAIAIKLGRTKSGSITYKAVDENTRTDDWDVLLVKFVSDPLPSNKFITGEVTFCLGLVESSTDANMVAHYHLYVTKGDSNNVRGTLLSNSIGVKEWSTRLSVCGILNSSIAITDVNALADDRIVLEVGYRAKNTSTTSYTGKVYYGGTNATDLSNNADGSLYTGWVEFSDDPWVEPTFNTSVNIGGTWKQASSVSVNIGGTWKTVDSIKSNIGGTWK